MTHKGDRRSKKKAEHAPDLSAPYRLLGEPWVRASEELAALREMVTKLDEYNEARHGGRDFRRVADALRTLAASLDEDLDSVETLQPHLREAGLQVDAEARGGARTRPGRRGRPPDLLTTAVVALLQKKSPDWDPRTPFPGRNTQVLRDWLHEELLPGPFERQDLDPRSRGPLYRVVSNLQRGASRKRLTP